MVVCGILKKHDKIISYQAEAGAQSLSLTNTAEAERTRLELTATARAAAFTNQIPAYKAAPTVYKQRLYAQVMPRAIADARKYVLVATNTENVISFDLQHRFDDEYIGKLGDAITSEPKK